LCHIPPFRHSSPYAGSRLIAAAGMRKSGAFRIRISWMDTNARPACLIGRNR
jgi:hypothetical protein